jgi:Zn-dependent protease with chaperone function
MPVAKRVLHFGGLIKTFAFVAACLFAASAHAHSLVDKIVNQLEASPAACTAVAADQPQRKRVEADLARFLMIASVPPQVRFQVMDCADDGFVYQGSTIVLSTRLSRLNRAQRFFIIAHELGHVALQHHAMTSKFVAKAVRTTRDERAARARVASGLPAMSQQNELDADAFAIRLMREAGEDPNEAARLFESIGEGKDNATHPSPGRRARAIRSML